MISPRTGPITSYTTDKVLFKTMIKKCIEQPVIVSFATQNLESHYFYSQFLNVLYILTGSLTGQFLCEKRIPLFVTDPSLTKSLIRLTTEKWFTDYRRIFLVSDSAAIYDLNSFYRRRKHAHPSAQVHYWRSYRNKFYYIFKIRYK